MKHPTLSLAVLSLSLFMAACGGHHPRGGPGDPSRDACPGAEAGAKSGAAPAAEAGRTIALLTDYGDKDFYVGAIKGSILSRFPEARIVDLTHRVTAFNIWEGAFTLLMASREFPADTVFVAIVDPGVGTARKPIVVRTEAGRIFVGPDNGLFTLVMQECKVKEVREITNRDWMRPGRISASFHGRDIFGPAAARIASGRPVAEAGPERKEWVTLPIAPVRLEGTRMGARVIFIDQYGNIQINAGEDLLGAIGLKPGDSVRVTVGTSVLTVPWAATYGDVKTGCGLLFTSSTGFMELAVNEGNAAADTKAALGGEIFLEKAKP